MEWLDAVEDGAEKLGDGDGDGEEEDQRKTMRLFQEFTNAITTTVTKVLLFPSFRRYFFLIFFCFT